MAAVRAIDTEDVYGFFNAVHLHRGRARSLHVTGAPPPPPGPPATRCPGMEISLGTLNGYAHWEEPATLLAPVGGGGEALVKHWAELVRRSQSQASRWRVLLDRTPILNLDGAQLVRLAHPYSFVPVPTENLVYCDGMDRQLANALLAEETRPRTPRCQASTSRHAGFCERPHRRAHRARGSRAFRTREQDGRTRRTTEPGRHAGRKLAFRQPGVAATTFENRVALRRRSRTWGCQRP